MWDDNGLAALAIVGVLLLVVVGPILGIWALNTLFGFSIEFTVKNWFAMFIIAGIFSSAKMSK